MPERILDRMPKEMRMGQGQFRDPSDDMLTYIVQLGLQDFLMNTASFPGDKQWEYEDLLAARKKAEKHGLRLMALENVPISFYQQVMLGEPGRDEQIGHMQTTIRNMGRAEIPILGIHWMPSGVWSTQPPAVLRGGSTSRRFNIDKHPADELTFGRVVTEEELWDNLKYYMAGILPVAEEAGVTLAFHPDDPPVPSLGGVARILRNFEGFKRLTDTFDSPNVGLNFCIGCWSEMGGHENVLRGIRHFGPRGQIAGRDRRHPGQLGEQGTHRAGRTPSVASSAFPGLHRSRTADLCPSCSSPCSPLAMRRSGASSSDRTAEGVR